MLKHSIILVVYNNLELTKKCIDSLIKYSNQDNLELIITDNASTDGTAEYLKEIPIKNKVIITNDKNKWFIRPVNKAVRASQGEYITLIGNDTEMCEGWLEKLTEPFKVNPKMGLVGISGQCCTLTGYGTGYKGSRLDYIDGTFLTIPRRIYEDVGLDINGQKCLFDENTFVNAYCEDADLSLRVTGAGYEIMTVDIPVKHIGGQTAMLVPFSKVYIQMNQEALIKKWELDKNPKYVRDVMQLLAESKKMGFTTMENNIRASILAYGTQDEKDTLAEFDQNGGGKCPT